MRFAFGRFYGTLRRRAEVAGIGLSETVYGAGARLPLHAHDSPYFCLVLRGGYAESDGRSERACRPSTLVFHPAGEPHANRFGADGGACFNLEFGSAWAARMPAGLCRPAALTGQAVGIAARLQRELHVMDDVSHLAIESLALELLVLAARRRDAGPAWPPPWLEQAEELIRARFAGPLALSEIAAAVHRHPVHLARQFRRHHGCTIGDFVRRLRLDLACRRLAATDEPLARIALDCGFAGQSPFSTSFRRAFGMAPRQYRDMFRRR